MTLSDLLEALCKADPERFQCDGIEFNVLIGEDFQPCYPADPELFLHDCQDIEYALREAIEARGWHWNVDGFNFPGRYAGTVGVPNGPEEGETFTEKCDTPAIALGMAYLKALGVEV